MPVLYALLVGIDRYRDVTTPLSGCRNDVTAVAAFLRNRVGDDTDLKIMDLCDEEATREAVIGAFRSHLGQAGPGDTALFWFSGHGSYAPVWPSLWYLEPSGELQTLLCVDSRHGDVPDLYDKELAVLTDEVAASGAHVALVLDSCHSGGANRGALATRSAPPVRQPPPLGRLLPEMVTRSPEGFVTGFRAGRADHVALAACQHDQLAAETLHYGPAHGIFTGALLAAAGRLDSGATYRELLTAARCEVENLVTCQVPQLHPANGFLADQPFLGGQVRPPGANMTMRHLHGVWEMDAGACHGLPTVDPEGALRVAVRGAEPVREARVVRVLTERSVVEPAGWQPDRERQYPIVVSSVPLPPTTVAVGGGPADDPALAARLVAALATAGPSGGPSPHLRVVEPAAGAPPAQLRVATPGRIRVFGADDVPLVGATGDLDPPALPGPDQTAALDHDQRAALDHAGPLGPVGGPGADPVAVAVRALEHIARWRQLRSLTNPLSRLAGAVTVELVPVRPGDAVVPLHRPGLLPAGDGSVRLDYRLVDGAWVPPAVFIRIHNSSDQPLYCTLLDLTARYRSHTDLFPGALIGPGRIGTTRQGLPVRFRLPDDQPPAPGRRTQDWLKLLVAEEPFNAQPFTMPRLHEPWPSASRAPMALLGTLDRLGYRVLRRDAEIEAPAAHDWTASTLPVVTGVPAVDGHHRQE